MELAEVRIPTVMETWQYVVSQHKLSIYYAAKSAWKNDKEENPMKHLVTTFILLLVLFGCQQNTATVTVEQNDADGAARAVNYDDYFGDHNPKLIGAWGGEKTHEDWFIQCVQSQMRVNLLRHSLEFHYAKTLKFPSGMDELDSIGYYPIRPLDPLNYQPIVYGSELESDTDFNNVILETSETEWKITGNTPSYPDGTWYEYTWDFEHPDGPWLNIAMQRSSDFGNPVAMRGAMLSTAFSYIVWNFEKRRAELPANQEELLDGLWYVHDEWAEFSEDIEISDTGVFVFGLYPSEMKSAAIWTDPYGNIYREAWLWDPWPAGWNEIPSVGERTGIHSAQCDPPNDFEGPEVVLWQCSLIME